MGNLADTFIVRLKPEFKEAGIETLMQHIPEAYQMMLALLWDHYASLEDILDTKNLPRIESMDFEQPPPQVVFAHRYRRECLQQNLRRAFFDTLLIIQHVYSPEKHNIIHVLREYEAVELRVFPNWHSYQHDGSTARCQVATGTPDIITEAEWATKRSEDEAFSNATIKDLEAKGFQVHPIE